MLWMMSDRDFWRWRIGVSEKDWGSQGWERRVEGNDRVFTWREIQALRAVETQDMDGMG